MESKPIVTARLRNHFYRDSYRRMMLVIVISLCFNIIMGAVAAWLFLNQPKPEYFATSPDGKLIAMVPLPTPYQSDRAVLAFATQAALSVTSYDYLNTQRDLLAARKYFTPAGFQALIKALNESGELTTLKNNGFVAKSQVANTVLPAVCTKGNESTPGRRYFWHIEVPLDVAYKGGQNSEPAKKLIAKLQVVRVSTAIVANGILVNTLSILPRTATGKPCG